MREEIVRRRPGVPLNQEPRMTQEAAFEAAIVALRAQGLEPNEFGLEIRDRMLRGELDEGQAIAEIKKYHQARVHLPMTAP
jgi:hypothetical protein